MILITGATGNIGTELVKRLVSKRTPIRIITRDEKKIAHLGPEVGRVIGDRHEPSVVQRALQEVEKVFVLSGPFDLGHEADRLLMNKAKNACVRQIVLISSSNITFPGQPRGIPGNRDCQFDHTPLSQCLRNDAEGSFRSAAQLRYTHDIGDKRY